MLGFVPQPNLLRYLRRRAEELAVGSSRDTVHRVPTLRVYVFLGVVTVQSVIACSNYKVQIANLNPPRDVVTRHTSPAVRYSLLSCGSTTRGFTFAPPVGSHQLWVQVCNLNRKVYVFLGVATVQLGIVCPNPMVQISNPNPPMGKPDAGCF